jgi:hypothetical protein
LNFDNLFFFYESKLFHCFVGLTIFKVGPLRDDLSTLKLLTISDVIASALTHRLDDIDVFINAWTPSSSFDQLDLATRDAIVYGATAVLKIFD